MVKSTKHTVDGSEVGRSPVEVGSLSTIIYGALDISGDASYCRMLSIFVRENEQKSHPMEEEAFIFPATLQGDVLVLNVAVFFRPPRS